MYQVTTWFLTMKWWTECSHVGTVCPREYTCGFVVLCFAVFCFVVALSWVSIFFRRYGDVIMSAKMSQITSVSIVYSTVYSNADQRKRKSTASLAFVRGIHRGTVNSPHKGTVTRKMFPFDDIIMNCLSGPKALARLPCANEVISMIRITSISTKPLQSAKCVHTLDESQFITHVTRYWIQDDIDKWRIPIWLSTQGRALGCLLGAICWKVYGDVIKGKDFPRNWPFVRGIHRSPVNSPHKGQWCGALMFSLICV